MILEARKRHVTHDQSQKRYSNTCNVACASELQNGDGFNYRMLDKVHEY